MIERLLVDAALRDRLVTEASEHVLSFDWDDIAQRTRGIYDGTARLAAPKGVPRGAETGRGFEGMREMLQGLMQNDFPLTLNHIRRRMQTVNHGAEVVTLRR